MDDDTDDKDDSKRKSRNLSEKKRRDQFNLLVNELSSMVSSTNRKMDKSTVLKSTIAYLKHHNEIAVRSRVHEIQEDWKPSYLSNEEFTHLILEALDGFIIVFSSTGRIFYASESITSLLGHLPSDLLNMTIYDLAYEEDHSEIYNILLNPMSVIDPLQNGLTRDNQVSFSCHLKRRGLDFRDEVTFELVQFVGYFRSDIDIENVVPNTRGGCYPTEGDTRLIFVGTGRLQAPQLIRDMSIVDSSKSEFTSRHSLEWKFLFLDHRAPPIIGYLPFEVLGTSGYDYYHFDDLEKVILCHEALMQKGEGTSCYYRFLTKGQQWIWLQTRFYITYHQWNSKPEFVVCTHRVVSYADVMKQLRSSANSNSNSGPCGMRDTDDSDTLVEKQTQSSSSDIHNPPTWISKSSRSSRFGATPKSPSVRSRSRYSAYHGNGSDSGSMSGESPISRHSLMTHYGTPRARLRHHQQQQNQQQKLHQQQQEQQQQQQQQQQQMPGHAMPGVNQIPPQQMHHQPHTRALGPPPIITPTYIEQQQYLAAIPVQPVIGPAFTSAGAVISPIQPGGELIAPGVVMTTTQSQLQDQLQRKHEELQQLIVQQQEELRRVSEQLLMARYGLLQPMVPVSNVTSNTTDHVSSQQQQMHHMNPHQQQSHAILIGAVDQPQPQPLQSVDQKSIDPTLGQAQGDEMVSYMQLTPVPSSHFHHLRLGTEGQDSQAQQQQSGQQTQPMGIPNELEVLPYQMSQEQSQILFNSPNSPGQNQ